MTSPADDAALIKAVARTEKRLAHYHEGLRVKSFDVGDNPVTDELAADTRTILARLTALNAELSERIEEGGRLRKAVREMLPRNVCLTNRNIPDDMAVPLECTMGDLRRIATLSTPFSRRT